MKNKKNILLIILILIIMGGIIYEKFFREPKHILDPNITWKTDTVYVDIPYTIQVPYEVIVPPRYITRYVVDSTAIDSLKVRMLNDSIIISSLKNQVFIHQNYLKQYLSNPKLISLALQFDTLSLSLLNIDGIVSSYDYPIFIDYFKYRWDNDGLTREDNKRKIPKQKTYLEYKVGVGYDLLYLTPYVQGQVSKQINKFDVYGRLGFGLLNNNSSEIKLGVDYNIGK